MDRHLLALRSRTKNHKRFLLFLKNLSKTLLLLLFLLLRKANVWGVCVSKVSSSWTRGLGGHTKTLRDGKGGGASLFLGVFFIARRWGRGALGDNKVVVRLGLAVVVVDGREGRGTLQSDSHDLNASSFVHDLAFHSKFLGN